MAVRHTNLSDMDRSLLAALSALVAGCSLLLSGCSGGPGQAPHASAPLSASLVLPSTTVKAGGQLAGQIVVENDTRHALQTHGCGSIFAVLLTSQTYKPTPAWPACLQAISIPRGRSSYPVTVVATYTVCGQSGSTADIPACTPSGPPALPTGDYEAKTFESSNVVPVPAAVLVHVVQSSAP